MVPLPLKPNAGALGESRSAAVRRFLAFEHCINHKGHFSKFSAAIQKYFDMGHAVEVPLSAMDKLPHSVYYLPMHAVRKDSSTVTKLRVVFDASAKLASGLCC